MLKKITFSDFYLTINHPQPSQLEAAHPEHDGAEAELAVVTPPAPLLKKPQADICCFI